MTQEQKITHRTEQQINAWILREEKKREENNRNEKKPVTMECVAS